MLLTLIIWLCSRKIGCVHIKVGHTSRSNQCIRNTLLRRREYRVRVNKANPAYMYKSFQKMKATKGPVNKSYDIDCAVIT